MEVDELAIERSWRARGFGFRAGTCDPFDTWVDEGHSVREIVMVASGAIRVRLGDDERTAAIGEEVIIPAGIPHVIENLGPEPARVLFGYEAR